MNKIKIDQNFLNDLINKSWLDSESIQNQINSIEMDSVEANNVIGALKNLLTSYYIFTGCLENIASNKDTTIFEVGHKADTIESSQKEEPLKITNTKDNFLPEVEDEPTIDEVSEPFEYFVDFEDPIGEPLTDEDLYNN